MTRRWTNFVICGLTVALLSVNATAQKKPPVSGAENGLVGIKLYDSGQRVIAVYGSPLEIHPVTFGTTPGFLDHFVGATACRNCVRIPTAPWGDFRRFARRLCGETDVDPICPS